jgi:TolB-like protein/class 3 adenylate cyclase
LHWLTRHLPKPRLASGNISGRMMPPGQLAMEPEQPGRIGRRLAAIVAADVAGYSRLMGLDEVGTARTLREHRKVTDALVAKHGGRIVKTTGDGLLLEFASVVDAVECAVAVQTVMAQRNEGIPQDRRMLFRTGINLGDILIEGEDILGDGVNVAARLEGKAEPGGICLSSSAYDQVRAKVPVEFTDLGEQVLKNIARPIRAYAVGLSVNPHQAAQLPSTSPHLSLVVLPFINIGSHPEQEYFVDGVTESLTTDLSRIAGAFVIARNTAFTFKGKAIDVKKLGRELNVRYVLEGSVQRGNNRLRVNVQLIDAETGNHLWAERFDKPIADLFEMQDEIVSRLANALDAELVTAEARRAEHSPHPDAMDLVFQGSSWFNKGVTPDGLARARSFFEKAIALDPENIGCSSAIDMRPSTLMPARRLRSRAPLSFATSIAFSNSETAPSTCRIRRAVGVSSRNEVGLSAAIRSIPRALSIAYNVQVAVDTEHHLIVAHEVTNSGSDRAQLANMAKQAKAVLKTDTLEAVADRGYFNSPEILACHEAGITITLPKPLTSGAKSDGRFGKQDFVYLPEKDAYRCPAGKQLPYRFTSEEDGKRIRRYWTTACQNCALKSQCTTGPERRIPRWEHEHLLDAVQQRLDANPQAMRQRRETIEHPFGTMKARMGATHFLTKTLPKVAEMALSVLAYNLTRVMNIVGIKPLIAAIAA